MKKLFTLLSLTLLLALGWSAKANATDYYVVGDLTSWTFTPAASIVPMTAVGDGSYTFEVGVNGQKWFCISDGDGVDWTDFNNHRFECSGQVTIGSQVTLSPGNNGMNMEGDGSLYRFTYIPTTKGLTVTKLDNTVYTVAGSEILFGSDWNIFDASNNMAKDGDNYTWTITNKPLSAGDVYFKIIKNHSYGVASYPGENYDLNISEAGLYDVTITFTPSTSEITHVATKKADLDLSYRYLIAADAAVAGGHGWDISGDNNVMAVDGNEAKLTLTDQTIDAGTYGYKVVKQTLNAGVSIGSEWIPAGDNLTFEISKSSKYNITYVFNIDTKSATATPTEQFTGYYIVKEGDSGNPWTVQGKMYLVSGTTYTGGVENWAGKCFAVAPNTALNDDFTGIKDWDKVLRPKNEGSNYIVDFNYYDDKFETTADNATNDKVWQVANTNDGMVDIAIYNDGTFSITCCTQAAIGEEGYATYSVAGPCEITDPGATAYIVVEEGGSYKLKEIPAGKAIPANTGIILKGSKGSYNVSSSTAAKADVSGNLLIGTGGSNYTITGNDGVKNYTPYIFANGNNGVGFYLIKKFDGTQTIDAHKAFLALPKGAGARAFIGFDETGEATGISASLNEKGEMVNKKVFNLSGQRVSQPTKGLYIVNGKKFVK